MSFPKPVQRYLLVNLQVIQKQRAIGQRHQTLNVGFSLILTSKGTWQQVFICLRPHPLNTSYPPPYTLYMCVQYTYS
jgi:hypothetical protein